MAKLTYSEQLRHPNWQRMRLKVLEAADWKCEECGDKDSTLNVHHKRYVKGRMAWEYEIADLTALCEPCHQTKHSDRELLDRLLCTSPLATRVAIGLLGGYLYAGYDIEDGIVEMVRQTDSIFFEIGVAAACLEGAPDDLREIVRQQWKRGPHPAIGLLIDEWDKEKPGG